LDAREVRRQAAREADAARKADEARDHWTLARCARDYHERVIERTRTDKHAAQWISSLEHHLPAALWHAPIGSIAPPALLQALDAATPHERARRPGDLSETLRRVRQRLDTVFEDAIFHGRCSANPAAAIRRKLHEARPADSKGQFLALDYRQAPALLSRIRAMPGTAARCLEFAVLTASRTSEALLATWDEFDIARSLWTLKAARMKRGEEHAVYLSPLALALIKAQAGQHQELVFPSPCRDSPLSNMALLATLDRMCVRDRTTVHGLCRATFSTWANETGAARPDVVEACLAHREADHVRRAYNRAQFGQERRALLEAWAQFLDTPAAQVLPLKAA
jgi:integrase